MYVYLAFEPPQSDQWSCMKTTHDSIQDLPIKKAKQSRPTREEILEGIGYTPQTFPESLHVPEAVRAAEDLAMQDYIVGWTLGLWDHINKFDAAAGRQRAGRARAKASPSRDQPNQI
jgi:hypothetical protein